MKNALIYSYNLYGHRQVYVFVIAKILHKSGYNVFISGNFSDPLFKNRFYIDQLQKDWHFVLIDANEYSVRGLDITNAEFRSIQIKYKIDLTILSDADNHIPLLVSQIKKNGEKLHGKVVGVFLRPFHFYRKMNLREKFRYYKHLYSRWSTDMRFFHEVLNRRNILLDKSLHVDDFFASKHKNTICIPDVFQQYADIFITSESIQQRNWIDKVDEFKRVNNGRRLLLYFGTAQQRRGYDQLLKLAVQYEACFIHCGLKKDDEAFNFDVNELRNILMKDNRLFETNEYITDPVCIEHFFRSVSHLILPYVDFYGSSGVMLQALGYNIPVLVPNVGIMGYRVKKYNLGQTYSQSLEKQFEEFFNTPVEKYSSYIEMYMKTQSAGKLESVLMNVFNLYN